MLAVILKLPIPGGAPGSSTISAALDIASGSVIAQHYRRHYQQEFLWFLKLIEPAGPDRVELHLVCANYATHKTPR